MNKVFIVIALILISVSLVGCDEIGLVEKSLLDSATSEIAQLKEEIEQANRKVQILEQEKAELQTRINEVEEENEEYLSILKEACHKSERLEKVINNEDYVSFWDLEQAITDLRDCLGFKQVYYNYSSQPFQSRQTTVTKQPDYLFE